MAKKYSQEIKEKARDYREIHSYDYEKISEIVGVPKSTISDWAKAGGWIKGRLKDKVETAKDKLVEDIQDNRVYQQVKQELIAEMKANNPSMTVTSVEEDVILDNRATSLLLEACNIENFDAMAMEGVMLANKKLKYLQNMPLEKVNMGEIKTYNDIVSNVKQQVFGKAPDTIIQVNQKNMTAQDYSQLSTDQLYAMLDKEKKKEAIEAS
jgi:transposase